MRSKLSRGASVVSIASHTNGESSTNGRAKCRNPGHHCQAQKTVGNRTALTMQSSGLAYGQPLTLAVSLRKIRNIEAHVLFTGVYLLKRLFVGFWISRRASPFGAAPVFSFFASIASLPWHTAFSRFALVVNLGLPILASVANRAVKPTCLRQAAYFLSLAA